jgi:hypothetical protein
MRAGRLLTALALSILACACGERDGVRPASRVDVTMAAAARYLWSQQGDDGGWHSTTYGLLGTGQALTPFVLDALLDVPAQVHPRDPLRVRKALAFLEAHLDEDGALGRAHEEIEDYPNYATALARVVLHRQGAPAGLLERTGRCLLRQQLAEAHGWTPDHPAYGAWGMGGDPRMPPHTGTLDISMTRYVIEGLAPGRLAGRDEAFERVQRFLGRLQNPGGDFIFTSVRMQANKAGPAPGGTGYAGYGSTTADGILSLRAAGVPASDNRIRRACDWLVAHHRTDRVPGFPPDQEDEWALSMVFYYRAAAARALAWLEVRYAPAGRNWRGRLAAALAKEQARDGSFRNRGTLMKEDDPLIATSLAIKALAVMR